MSGGGRAGDRAGRPRVALVSVRFTMFDAQMPADFPDRMRGHAERSAALLETRFDVVRTPLVERQPDAELVAVALEREPVDAVVFAPTMAAPPAFAADALARSRAPLVVWNAPAGRRLPADMTQADATEHTTGVGALMFANVLSRLGRAAPVVTAAHDDPAGVERLLRTVAGAAAAGGLAGTTILRLGQPIAGYLDVEAPADALGRLGVREAAVSRERWEAAVAAVPDAAAGALLAAVRERGWAGEPGPAAAISSRVAIALDGLLAEAGAAAGALNCHGPFFRDSAVVGVTACLGVACQALAGRSVACTGDVPTAVTLHLARRLAGAALYCELYGSDLDAGLALIAAGGEGDPAWAEPGTPVRLEPNHHYPGRNGPGTGVSFGLRRGPATLLSLSPAHDGWVLAWATGTVETARHPRLGGPNGMFRFDSGPLDEAISRWIASGATHHCALAPGRLEVELPVLAAALGVRAVRC